MKLITNESCSVVDEKLIQEYNLLQYQLNRDIFRFTEEEVISKYNRIKELMILMEVYQQSSFEQLNLF